MKKIFKCILTAVLFLSVGTNVYAEGEETQDNDESTQIITNVSETDVAKIGDQGYETLQAAIDAAGETETTITLVDDVTDISTVEVDEKQNIILDLNGKTISTAESGTSQGYVKHYYAINNYGTLQIKDSVGTGKISSRGLDNYGTMIIESGTFEIADSKNGGANVYNEEDCDLTINGGTFNVPNGSEDLAKTGDGAQNIYNDGGNVLITAGTFESTSTAIYSIFASGGTLKITPAEGKQVYVHGTKGALGPDGGTTVINGGTFVGDNFYAMMISSRPGKATVTINGGSFTGKDTSVLIGSDTQPSVDATLEINGGTFNNGLTVQPKCTGNPLTIKGGSFVTDVSSYLPDGYHINEVDGKYVVQQTVVAEINGVKYSTVQKAIDENDKVTINVVADTAENITIPSGKTITLNIANGVTITNNGGHTITNNGKLTVTGAGTVDNVSHGKGAVYNNVGGVAKLEGDVTFTRSQEAGIDKDHSGGNSWYTIKNFGVMSINDNVKINQGSTGHDGYSSLIGNGWQSYSEAPGNGEPDTSSNPVAMLTITGGTISGGLNTIKNDDGGYLEITGGSLTNTHQHVIMNWNEARISSGTFVNAGDTMDVIYTGNHSDESIYQGKTTITGGTFTAGKNDVIFQNKDDTSLLTVTGGTYSVDISEYLADGYNLAKISGKYVVVKKGENAPVKDPITPAVDDKAFDEISKSEDIPDNATVTSVKLEASEVSKENLNEEETKKVEDKVVEAITEAKTAKILLPLNINLKATTETKVDGVTTGTKEVNVTKLNKAITATIYLDDATLAELTGKTIKVVRVHTEDGKTEYTVLDATLTGNALCFETDKFSNYYVVTYATEIKDEPKPSVSPEPEEPVEPVEPEEKIVFIDVDEKTDHNESIDWLAGTGVSEGWKNSDGTREFRPYAEVARADMAAFLKRLGTNCFDDTTAFTPSEEDWATFTDVVAAKSEQDQYHQDDILWLAKYKISEGWAVGTTREFRPFEKVTRADMAAFLRRLAKKYDLGDANTWEPSEEDWATFKDVVAATSELDQYHQEDILWLAHAKISTGFNDGTFRPFDTVKRCDMAAFLQRLAKLD